MYPLSNCIPSVNSSSTPVVFGSSTEMTPSAPTFSKASAIRAPTGILRRDRGDLGGLVVALDLPGAGQQRLVDLRHGRVDATLHR